MSNGLPERTILLASVLVVSLIVLSLMPSAAQFSPGAWAEAMAAERTTPAPLVAPTAAPRTWTRPADSAVMVAVPAGEFIMGSTDAEIEAAFTECSEPYVYCPRDWFTGEAPQHTVTLDAFWIDMTEVTNRQFEGFVQATDYRTEAETGGGGWACDNSGCGLVEGVNWRHPEGRDSSISDRMEHPVVQVTWSDATAYCAWAGARLPTEAEWEKAARGSDGRTYPWGNEFDSSKVNFCDKNCEVGWNDANADDGYGRTAPVGSYPAGASPYGALDMAGNVYEWVADWYAGDYYGRAPARNPPGPEPGEFRVMRGGGWGYARGDTRCAYRYWRDPDDRHDDYGFRCGMSSTSSR